MRRAFLPLRINPTTTTPPPGCRHREARHFKSMDVTQLEEQQRSHKLFWSLKLVEMHHCRKGYTAIIRVTTPCVAKTMQLKLTDLKNGVSLIMVPKSSAHLTKHTW